MNVDRYLTNGRLMSPPSSELRALNCVRHGHIILAHENGLIMIKKSSCEPRARAKGRPAHWHLEGGGSGDRANTSPMSFPVRRPSAAAAMGMTMMGRARREGRRRAVPMLGLITSDNIVS